MRLPALGGYSLASDAQQEALVLHDLKLQRLFAGGRALLRTDAPNGPRALELSAERDLVSRNALSGWRIALTARAGL